MYMEFLRGNIIISIACTLFIALWIDVRVQRSLKLFRQISIFRKHWKHFLKRMDIHHRSKYSKKDMFITSHDLSRNIFFFCLVYNCIYKRSTCAFLSHGTSHQELVQYICGGRGSSYPSVVARHPYFHIHLRRETRRQRRLWSLPSCSSVCLWDQSQCKWSCEAWHVHDLGSHTQPKRT